MAPLPLDKAGQPVGSKFSPVQVERLNATGFLRMATDGSANSENPELARNQVIADTIKIVSSSLLGVTVGCAQCHDHRYDPISQEDYYAIRAVFEPAFDWQHGWRTPGERLVSMWTDADRAKAAAIEADVSKIAAEREAKQAELIAAVLEEVVKTFAEPLRD